MSMCEPICMSEVRVEEEERERGMEGRRKRGKEGQKERETE